MAVVSGRMPLCEAPRPMPPEPANPTSYGPARRGAALICWGAFPARRDDELRGALGIGGDGRGGVRVGRSGGMALLPAPRLPSRPLTFCGGASLLCNAAEHVSGDCAARSARGYPAS
eukprot:2125572-Prymnesium_polylepis.1